jgi:hypothetical protein
VRSVAQRLYCAAHAVFCLLTAHCTCRRIEFEQARTKSCELGLQISTNLHETGSAVFDETTAVA